MHGTFLAAPACLGARGAGPSVPSGDARDSAGAGGGEVSARIMKSESHSVISDSL